MTRKDSLSVLLAVIPAAFALAGDWTWQMPVEHYQQLDFEHRSTIDKARAAYQKAEGAARNNASFQDVQLPLFRAAAAEWQKYTVQYELDDDFSSEAVSAYVLFMQGYSLQGAHDRYKAIKKYQEVLDLYPTETWITAAALYMIGDNQMELGEQKKGRSTYESIVENKEMSTHPLASSAFRKLGNMAWSEGNESTAMDMWTGGSAPVFKDTATWNYNEQRGYLRNALLVTRKWNEYEEAVFEGIKPEDNGKRLDAVIGVEDFMSHGWHRQNLDSWYFQRKYPDEKKRSAAWKQFDADRLAWHEKHKQLFVSQKREWGWTMRAISYRNSVDKKEAVKLIPEMKRLLAASSADQMLPRTKECIYLLRDCGFGEEMQKLVPTLKTILDKSPKELVEPRAKEIISILCSVGMHTEARLVLPYIKDKVANLWKVYEIDCSQQKFRECVPTLEAIIAQPDPAVSLSGKKSLLWLYTERLGEFEKAIPLIKEVVQPPKMLWDLQHCYRRLKRNKEAYAALKELQFFPDQACRALWTEAEYHKDDGEKDLAIGMYRRILAQPEWKKSNESSMAHQRLEAWGINTGGAVINEVR